MTCVFLPVRETIKADAYPGPRFDVELRGSVLDRTLVDGYDGNGE